MATGLLIALHKDLSLSGKTQKDTNYGRSQNFLSSIARGNMPILYLWCPIICQGGPLSTDFIERPIRLVIIWPAGNPLSIFRQCLVEVEAGSLRSEVYTKHCNLESNYGGGGKKEELLQHFSPIQPLLSVKYLNCSRE